jgi:hypothetical protein
MPESTFKLDDRDAAIIIKHDMSTEVIIPKLDDAEHVTFEDNQNIFITLAISGAMSDDNFREVISAKLDEMFTKAEEDGVGGFDAPDDTPDCDTDDPSCGGCQGCG